jgi:hypothetical protein
MAYISHPLKSQYLLSFKRVAQFSASGEFEVRSSAFGTGRSGLIHEPDSDKAFPMRSLATGC